MLLQWFLMITFLPLAIFGKGVVSKISMFNFAFNLAIILIVNIQPTWIVKRFEEKLMKRIEIRQIEEKTNKV